MSRVSVAVVTRNRRAELLSTLERLTDVPTRPPVIVVDNGSDDGTAAAVRSGFPEVDLVVLPENRGAAARNLAVERAGTALVAFADDDSWWAPDALARAADVFDAHPRLGLVCGRILVGTDERLDPVSRSMAESPLPRAEGAAGPPLLGFVACGTVVRRRAFLEAGGFEPRFVIGGEEQMLALDLAAAGWQLAYRGDVVAHHHPSPRPRGTARERVIARNDLWTLWMRRRPPAVALGTVRAVARMAARPRLWPALAEAFIGLPWAVRSRRPVPPDLEQALRRLGD